MCASWQKSGMSSLYFGIWVFKLVGRLACLASCRQVWNAWLFCLLFSAGIKNLNIDSWPVFRFRVFMIFARSVYQWSSHFTIASLFLLRIITQAANFDLSTSVSFLGALYQVLTCRCNRVRWNMYQSFLDPNNVWCWLEQNNTCQQVR